MARLTIISITAAIGLAVSVPRGAAAGEIIIADPPPGIPPAAPLPHNTDRARQYADPNAARPSGPVLLVVPDPLAPARPPSPALNNELSLRRNQERAREYMRDHPGDAVNGPATVIVVPGAAPGGLAAAPPIDNATRVQMNNQAARDYANGNRGCAGSSTTVGVVEGVARLPGGGVAIVTDGVNTFGARPNCR